MRLAETTSHSIELTKFEGAVDEEVLLNAVDDGDSIITFRGLNLIFLFRVNIHYPTISAYCEDLTKQNVEKKYGAEIRIQFRFSSSSFAITSIFYSTFEKVVYCRAASSAKIFSGHRVIQHIEPSYFIKATAPGRYAIAHKVSREADDIDLKNIELFYRR